MHSGFFENAKEARFLKAGGTGLFRAAALSLLLIAQVGRTATAAQDAEGVREQLAAVSIFAPQRLLPLRSSLLVNSKSINT